MFIENQNYSRREDIHEAYGGQQQGGICTPKDYPFIFIFTGKSGEQHGYADGWQDEGVFLYTGEGQLGDMQFIRGNAAIRDHIEKGKDLLLFQSLGKSKPVRFMGTFACQSWDVIEGQDTAGDTRKSIQFHLVKTSASILPLDLVEDQKGVPSVSADLDVLRAKAMSAASPQKAKQWKTAPSSYRERSKAVRNYVLARAQGICELTGKPAPFLTKAGNPYLEVHHIRRLADEGPDDPRFVAAICPAVHREIHFGVNGDALNSQLLEKISRLEKK